MTALCKLAQLDNGVPARRGFAKVLERVVSNRTQRRPDIFCTGGTHMRRQMSCDLRRSTNVLMQFEWLQAQALASMNAGSFVPCVISPLRDDGLLR